MTRVRPPLTILDAVADDKLFAPWFRDRATWNAWFALLATLFGLPLTDEQLAIYRQCTGRKFSTDRTSKRGLAVMWAKGWQELCACTHCTHFCAMVFVAC